MIINIIVVVVVVITIIIIHTVPPSPTTHPTSLRLVAVAGRVLPVRGFFLVQ